MPRLVEETIYDFSVTRIDGSVAQLSEFRGQVLLIVNTASQCGFTPQYAALEELYRAHKDRGFSVLAFPCNQFGGQEPGSPEEIGAFCKLNFGVSFPLFGKIDVNGPHTAPLYRVLKRERPGILWTEKIKWNFTKFLVDRSGKVICRRGPSTKPQKLVHIVEGLLAHR